MYIYFLRFNEFLSRYYLFISFLKDDVECLEEGMKWGYRECALNIIYHFTSRRHKAIFNRTDDMPLMMVEKNVFFVILACIIIYSLKKL